MPRTAANPSLSTRTARSRLERRTAPYWFTLSPGLAVGYSRRGGGPAGSWLARYRDARTGQRYQTHLGTADDVLDPGTTPDVLSWSGAQAAARAWVDGLAGTTARRKTVADACRAYLADLEGRATPRGYEDAALRSRGRIEPQLGRIALTELTTDDIRGWMAWLVGDDATGDALRARRNTANRVFHQLKATLNHAFREGWVATDLAWRRVRPFARVESARDVFLTDDECDVLLRAADALMPEFGRLVLAGLETGCRLGELTAATVADFDAVEGVLHIRAGKTGARDVWLSEAAITLFKKVKRGLLLPDDRGVQWYREKVGHLMRRVAADAELPSETVFYSLRHTHISRCLVRGIPAQLVAENCGTSVRMIERNYGKFHNVTRRAAFR